MFTQGFGEVLADILTINPILSGIPSASAILDTSNFTFNAITYGKDANGFKFHAHTVSTVVVGIETIYNDGYLTFTRYNSISPSSYHSSATHSYFSSTYSSVPNYPSVYDTRLERASTITNVENTSDVGHYLNAAIDGPVSAAWNVIGAFPPSGNVGKYRLMKSDGTMVFSGNLSGVYNTFGIVDKLGYVKIAESPASAVSQVMSSGPFISAPSSFATDPVLDILICPQLGDAASLAAFGGVNHIGLYCLDLKQMLANGLRPPFAWNHLNNNRKYKLVAKATFWRDLLHHDDATDAILQLVYAGASKHYSGYRSLLVDGYNDTGTLGPSFIIRINF
jgi:hypothetical protein